MKRLGRGFFFFFFFLLGQIDFVDFGLTCEGHNPSCFGRSHNPEGYFVGIL